jgi:TolB-like protein
MLGSIARRSVVLSSRRSATKTRELRNLRRASRGTSSISARTPTRSVSVSHPTLGGPTERVERVVDTLDSMLKAGPRHLTIRQWQAGQIFRSAYEVLEGAVGNTMDFDRIRGETVAELCQGLPESVITGLSRLRWLSVAARNSSFAATEAGRDMAKLATRLGVDYLLEGSVQKRASRLRITAQLIDARGSHLWAEHYDSSTDDLFALQDELTQKIVAAVEQTLVTATLRVSANVDDLTEAPLRRANKLHRSLKRQANADAQTLLRDLVASPNASVAAYQLLANTLELTIDCFWADDPAATAAEALAVSQRAVQLLSAVKFDNSPRLASRYQHHV